MNIPIISDLKNAIEFLTIFSLGPKKAFNQSELARAMVFFPLVGLLLGVLIASLHFLMRLMYPSAIADAFALIALIFFTKAFHIDGFCDTIEGFMAGNDREEILRVMKDPSIGAYGASALLALLSLKFLALYYLAPLSLKVRLLIIMPVMGRWAQVQMAHFSSYARIDSSGVGRAFVLGATKKILSLSGLSTFFITLLFLGIQGIWFLVILCLFTALFTYYSKKKIGGATGDTLGAVNELSELLTLLLAFLIWPL